MSSHRPVRDEPLRLVHHHPGRLRARANVFLDAKEDSPAVVAARTAAVTTAGFRSWSHHPKTGSIVVEYQPGGVDPDVLLERIATQTGLRGVVHDTADQVHREELVNILLDSVKSLNRLAAEMTAGRADLRELVPGALAFTSVVSFVLNPDQRRLPRWDNALWWGYRVFQQWHCKEIVAKTGDSTGAGELAR
jgi:hypothetical protein